MSELVLLKQNGRLKIVQRYMINTVNPRIDAWGANFKFRRRRGALIRGRRLIEGGRGGAYLIFPKSWPDMIILVIRHLRVNKDKSCL